MSRYVKFNFRGNNGPPTLTCADLSLALSFAKLFVMGHMLKERICASIRKPPPIKFQAGPDRPPVVKATLRARYARP
jgi:hypothetical protein